MRQKALQVRIGHKSGVAIDDLRDFIVVSAESVLRDCIAPTVAQIFDISVVGFGPTDFEDVRDRFDPSRQIDVGRGFSVMSFCHPDDAQRKRFGNRVVVVPSSEDADPIRGCEG